MEPTHAPNFCAIATRHALPFSEAGKLKNSGLRISYGPQCLTNRKRDAYVYLHPVSQPTAERGLHEEAVD
jgi:hypothetical protein